MFNPYHLALFLIFSIFYIWGVVRFWKQRNIRKKNELIAHSNITSEITHSLKKRISYFFWEKIFIVLGSFCIILSIYFITLKLFYFNPHLHNSAKQEENITISSFDIILTHFDVTGILIGIIGIIVGFLIFVVVENENEKKTVELNAQLTKLETVTTKIEGLNTDIIGRLAHLNQHPNLSARLLGIKEIIDHATKNSNHLYTLSYAPIYGQFIMCNAKVLFNEKENNSALDKMTQRDFYNAYIKSLHYLKNKNKNALLNYSSDNAEKLHMAILKSDWIDSWEPAKFKHFVQDRVIRDNEVVTISEESDEKMPTIIYDGKVNPKNIYISIYPESKEKKASESLIDALIQLDKSFLAALCEGNKNRINYLDYIPFQFFLSFPENLNAKPEYASLIVFTNYYDLGQDHSAVSFSSGNKKLCVNLRDMFNGLIKSQEQKDSHVTFFKRLFQLEKYSTLKIILKSIDIEPQRQFSKYRKVTPVADNVSKEQLLSLLSKNDVKHTPIIKYLHEEEIDNFLISGEEQEFSLISLGLFFNPLSERIGYNPDNKNKNFIPGRLFRLIQASKVEGTVHPKRVDVACTGNINSPYTINYFSFLESYSIETEGPRHDYAVFSRQKLDNRWIFIFGGINHFASQNISKCLDEKNCEFILQKTLRNEQYIVIFKVVEDQIKPASVEFLSIVDDYGNISNIVKSPQNDTAVTINTNVVKDQ